MPFAPRLPDEIRQAMVARVVATSSLTDVAEGGVLQSILGAVADELALIESRAYDMSVAHGLGDNVKGDLLYDRLGELPPPFTGPRGPQPARGGHPIVVRSSAVDPLTIPPGGLQLGRFDDPKVVAENTNEIVFDVGQLSYPGLGDDPVMLECRAPGEVGNAQAGVYNVLLTQPTGVIQAATTTAMSGGTDGETDDQARHRGRLWVQGLVRSTRDALTSAALEFEYNGQRLLYAVCKTDPDRPGVTYIIVDDGFGMTGYQQAALPYTSTVPTLVSGARYVFPFNFPAATPPALTVTRGGVSTTYQATTRDWDAQEERGVLRMVANPMTVDIQPGDTVVVGGHTVFNGILARLQAHLIAHYVGEGTRVIVRPAQPLYVSLSANVVAESSEYDLADLIARVKNAIVAFFVSLGPGDPLYMHELHDALGNVRGLKNIVFDQGDKYPGDDFFRLTTAHGLLDIH